jgi:hypothetical protein
MIDYSVTETHKYLDAFETNHHFAHISNYACRRRLSRRCALLCMIWNSWLSNDQWHINAVDSETRIDGSMQRTTYTFRFVHFDKSVKWKYLIFAVNICFIVIPESIRRFGFRLWHVDFVNDPKLFEYVK